MEVDARLRLRAARYVAGLALAARDDRHGVPPGIDAATLRRQREVALAAALEIYVELGALSEREALEWREAAAGAERGRTAPGHAGDPRRAAALLERRLGEVTPGGDGSRFWQTLSAATMAGALSVDEHRAWIERGEDRMLGAQRAADARRDRARRRHRADDLRAVVCGPAPRASGLCVTSVELYADALLVSWRMPSSGERGGPLARLRVADDVGTEYVEAGGGGGGGGGTPRPWVGRSVAVPSPPAHARGLEIELDDERFVADLGGGVVR